MKVEILFDEMVGLNVTVLPVARFLILFVFSLLNQTCLFIRSTGGGQ